jgi:hypothetical protein
MRSADLVTAARPKGGRRDQRVSDVHPSASALSARRAEARASQPRWRHCGSGCGWRPPPPNRSKHRCAGIRSRVPGGRVRSLRGPRGSRSWRMGEDGMTGTVTVGQRDNVLLATLENPPHGLMDRSMVVALGELAARADADRTVGAVGLTGGHESRFLAHYDVGEILSGAEAGLSGLSPGCNPGLLTSDGRRSAHSSGRGNLRGVAASGTRGSGAVHGRAALYSRLRCGLDRRDQWSCIGRRM